jgi:hypothetical protein
MLGRGGMGEVWLGTDLLLRRPVAVKLVPSDSAAGTDLAERLLGECRLVARLQHPGITVAHDVGEDHGSVFFVMELLDGQNLQAIVDRSAGGLAVDRALHLAAQVADALAAAHAAGIIHRDVKPGNLMVLAEDRLKICDFGIARIIHGAGRSTLTGTPAYMAPEQIRGEAVDGRTDLYALGCVLHAMLTGRPPFQGESLAEVFAQHLNAGPPSSRSVRADVPRSLEHLVLSLLAKDPGDRPRDAVAVAEILRGIRDGRYPHSEPPAPPGPAAAGPHITFTIDVAQNEYLAPGTSNVNAILDVTASTAGAAVPASIVFVAGCSPRLPANAMAAVQDAIADAIDRLGEHDSFAVIGGSGTVDMIYPRTSRLAAATPAARAEARRAVRLLRPTAHAAFGFWMRHAVSLTAAPRSVRHVVLVTDMVADVDVADDLLAATAVAGGRWTCDVRGIGTDWEVAQLRRIATHLDGTIDIILDAADLGSELAQIVDAARDRMLAGLTLRVRATAGGAISFVKQISPSIEDLTRRGRAGGPDTTDYPIGSWGAEARSYHIQLRLTPGPVGERRIAARVRVTGPAGDPSVTSAEAEILATWADDEAAETTISQQVPRYTGQAELAAAIDEGLRKAKER